MKKQLLNYLATAMVALTGFVLNAQSLQPTTTNLSLTPISNGISMATGGNYDDAYAQVLLDFPVEVNGTSYDSIWVSANGFAWFGAPMPAASTVYQPLSVTANAVIISAFGADLHSNISSNSTSDWLIVTRGNAPARELVIEWRDANFFTNLADPATESFSFQIVIKESDHSIHFVYDTNFKSNFASDEVQIGIFTPSGGLQMLSTQNGSFSNPNWVSTSGSGAAVSSSDFPTSGSSYSFSSNSVSVPEPAFLHSFYPNPISSGVLTIDFQGNNSGLLLLNSTGTVVKSLSPQAGESKVRFELQGIRPGIYFLYDPVSQGRQKLTILR